MMEQCLLQSTTRSLDVCSKHFHHLSDDLLTLVQQRAAVHGSSTSNHTYICMYHYNQYVFHWKAEGCIDPQCCLLYDIQVAYRALVECPQRVLSVLKNIHKLPVELPIGSLIHKYPCLDTFDERYRCHDGYQPPKKRQRVRHCPSQQKCDNQVRMCS